jgi:Uma2 family endonuclease
MRAPSGSTPPLTVEQYEDRLLEGDRWIELVAGRLVRLDPPDQPHGDVVRNLSKPLATFLKTSPDLCACFELPLVISREPATIRCPAVSCFRSTERFAEVDKIVTDTRPALVIEVASTNDRREGMSERVKGYLAAGVSAVWVIDPVTRHVHQFHPPHSGIMLKEIQTLRGAPVLSGFEIHVSELFRPPTWDRS